MKGKPMRFCQAYESCHNFVHHAKINDPSIAANYGCIVYFKTKPQWYKKASDGITKLPQKRYIVVPIENVYVCLPLVCHYITTK